jgi:hypothetical protein
MINHLCEGLPVALARNSQARSKSFTAAIPHFALPMMLKIGYDALWGAILLVLVDA